MEPTTTAQTPTEPAVTSVNTAIKVELLAPRGLGYGEGTISYEARLNEVDEMALRAAVTSPDILVSVDTDDNGNLLDDDGCGDGRKVVKVIEGTAVRKRSLNRPKVFGGGATMAMAALIGMGKITDVDLNEAFRQAMKTLNSLQIGYGAHTDTHATDNNCGCGAIDKAPLVLQNIVKYRPQIMGTMSGLHMNIGGIDDVMEAFIEYTEKFARPESYSGRKVADDIIASGVVVKDLDDDHKEMYIVLNEVSGTTINQEHIRVISNDQAQVFGVDVWRLQDIARRLYPGDPIAAHKAFLGGLIYSFGVAATLTKGDLPVFAVSTS